jgi:hypothetical protein
MIMVEVDTEEAMSFLRMLYSDQVPYAASLALNATGLQVQAAERREIGEAFTLRRRDWAMRNVKIGREDFATKTKLRTIVRMEAPGDASRSDILSKFEQGGTKRPREGKSLAVPGDVQRTGTGVIPRSKRPKAFNLRPAHAKGTTVFRGKGRSRSGTTVLVGDKGVFAVLNADGTGAIYQRTGISVGPKGRRKRYKGRRLASDIQTRQVRDMNIRTLYRFTPSAKVDSRLHFETTAKGVITARFSKNFEEAMAKAIAGGRGSVGKRIARTDVSR